MAEDMDTAKVASEIGTDARTLRKFLRSSVSPLQSVGQGARYTFTSADIPELKEKFESWRGGRRGSSSTPSTPKSIRTRTSRAPVEKIDPLEADSIVERLNSSIGDRQRKHNLVCNHSWAHPRVKGLTVKCVSPTVKASKFCSFHPQMTWCGDEEPMPMVCGPSPERRDNPSGHPYCRYHAGDISESEFNLLMVDNPGADLIQ
jgi:hypothetical protein